MMLIVIVVFVAVVVLCNYLFGIVLSRSQLTTRCPCFTRNRYIGFDICQLYVGDAINTRLYERVNSNHKHIHKHMKMIFIIILINAAFVIQPWWNIQTAIISGRCV